MAKNIAVYLKVKVISGIAAEVEEGGVSLGLRGERGGCGGSGSVLFSATATKENVTNWTGQCLHQPSLIALFFGLAGKDGAASPSPLFPEAHL